MSLGKYSANAKSNPSKENSCQLRYKNFFLMCNGILSSLLSQFFDPFSGALFIAGFE